WEAKVDQKKSIILTVSMKRGFHIVRWGNKIDKKLEEIRKQLPADVKLQTLYNQPVAVQHSVDKFLKSFIEAIVLVIIILGIGLGLRNAGIVALAIPLIVLATFGVMNCLKIELHQMSISALIIVLGMIVDNSVVVIDNIERYLQLGYSKVEASIKGTLEVSSALFSGTAAIVTAFLVLTFVSGSLGEYIRALPMVICISLIVSYFVALLVSPPLASILAKSHVKNKDEKDSEKGETTKKSSLFRRIYYKFVDLTQRFKAFSLFTLLGLFVASLYMAANYIPISFFPPADKSQFLVNVFLPEGSDIYATRDRVALIEKKLEQMKKEISQEPNGKGKENGKPLVSSYVTYLGQSGPRFFIAILPRAPMNRYAHIMVTTPDGKQTRKAAQELREYLNSNLPGAIVDIILLETGPPVDYPIEIRISGNDVKNLQEIGRKVEDILTKTNGIVSMSNDYGVNSQKIVVKVDQDRAKMLGISSSDVAAGLYTGLQGYPVTKLNAPERQIDVVLRMEKNKRQTIDDLKAVLFVSSLTGTKHRLDEFADVFLDTYPSAIMRRNEQRTLSVCSFVKGRLPDEVLKEIKPQIAGIKLPYGYKISYGGQSEETDKAFNQLVPLVLLGFTLMFLILAFKFKSIKIALAIYMSLPMALIGSIIGMFIMKQSFGFMSAIGLTSLGGIVVYNAIVIVEFIHNNLKSGKETLEAIKEAGFIRIRPILMTATCAIGGLLPLAMSGTPLFEPLCWVIIFGLAFSTIMTLLMTPLFYVVFGGVADSMRIIENEKQDEKALSENLNT
ncbi:MAG: efflux RND transporter permease subunit, partial [Firmicutes bacterium]|nr:efflux RND transporter permease subunit [Bacillota bacterium]